LGFIAKLNWLIEIFYETLKKVFRIRLCWPFLAYAVIQFALLTVLAFYNNPTVHAVLSPMISIFAGEKAELLSHYPGLYLLLPTVFQWGKLLLGTLFEGLAAGWTALLFWKLFASPEQSRPAKSAFSKWPQLLVVWTIITGFLIFANWLLPQPFAGLLEGSPRRIALFELLLRLATVFLYSIFIYAVPALVIFNRGIWEAFKTSFSYFMKYPILSCFLTLIPYLISMPTTYLASKSDVVVGKFNPELVFYILTAGLIADFFVNIITTGAVVKFLADEAS
jgi:hypothetical protein